MAEPAQESLIVRRIGDIPVGMFAHRRYLECHGTPRTIADLARHRLIGFDRQTALRPRDGQALPGVREPGVRVSRRQ
jgi:hypothetical protein